MSAAETQADEFSATVRQRMADPGNKPPGELPQLLQEASLTRLHLGASVRRVFCYIAPAGTSADAVIEQKYWAPVHKRLSVWDRIEVIEELGAFFAELIVLHSDVYGARVAPLRGIELHGMTGVRNAGIKNTIGAVVAYRGPQLKWSVILDDRVLRDGFDSEGLASAYLADYIRTRERTP